MAITSLPKNPTPAKTSFSDFAYCFYGELKIGKSTMAANTESPLFLDTESGLNAITASRVAIECIEDFRNVYDLLKKGDHSYKTVVIDTIDNAYRIAAESIVKTHNKNNSRNIEHISDIAYSKGWDMVRAKINGIIRTFAQLPLTLILIGHSKKEKFKPRNGEETEIHVLNLPSSIRSEVMAMMDMILYFGSSRYFNKEKNRWVTERLIHCSPSNVFIAGGRLNFGSSPINMGKSGQEAYDNLTKRFNEVMKRRKKNVKR